MDSAAESLAASHVSALIRAGNELSGHRPLPELFRFILELSIQAVKADRGVLMTIEGGELVVQANQGRGLSHQHGGARPRARQRPLHSCARHVDRRRVPRAPQHRGAEYPHSDGGSAANARQNHRHHLCGFAFPAARVHERRSESADRDGKCRGHPDRADAFCRSGAGAAADGARSGAGRGDSAGLSSVRGPAGARTRSGRTQRSLPHGRRRLLRFLSLREPAASPWCWATSPAKACPLRC